MRAANAAREGRGVAHRRSCRGRASSLALLHRLDRHGVVEQRQVELDERGVGRERRREARARAAPRPARRCASGTAAAAASWASISAMRGLELAGGVLDLLERLAAPLEALRRSRSCAIDLRRDRLVPELELAARVLEHDAQLGDQHAPELLHELRLRQAQRQRQAEVLDVVALDQLQLAREAVEVERLADRQAEAELGVEARERRAEHLADLAVAALRRRRAARAAARTARRRPCARRG